MKKYFQLGDVFYYFVRVFKKPNPNDPTSFNLRMMHGINRISIVMFLFLSDRHDRTRFYKMNLESIRDFCLELPGVTEELPFGPDTLVFKVIGKVFLLTPIDGSATQFNAKCDPERAEELREKYSDIQQDII